MPNLNKVLAAGHAGRDGELKFFADGNPILQFSLAVSDGYRDRQTQEWKESTEWMNVVVRGEQAERIAERVVKGAALFVEGKLKTRTFDDKDGKRQYRTEIVADRVQFLGAKDSGDNRNSAPASTRSMQRSKANANVDVDDLSWE